VTPGFSPEVLNPAPAELYDSPYPKASTRIAPPKILPGAGTSRHERPYRGASPESALGGEDEPWISARASGVGLCPIPSGGSAREGVDSQQLLRYHRLPPQVRDSPAVASSQAQAEAPSRPPPALWPPGSPGADQGLGSGQLSLVGASEGSLAALAALDSATSEDLLRARNSNFWP
jgi:hypothetical protein